MPLPTVRQLTYLIAVADTGRFNLAAERVHVSQPALSEQIAQLEHRLGARLLERGRQGATLTPVGREIAARARRILADVRELEEVVRSTAKNLGGLIRLGALPTLGPYLLPRVVPDLHAAHPHLRLYVREARSVELETGLRDGDFDVALSNPPDHTAGLTVEPLFQEPMRVGVAADHPLAERTVITLDDLSGLNMLTLEPGHHLSARVRTLAEAAGGRLQTDYEGTSLDGVRQMVGMGMGVSLFPALYVRSEMRADDAVVARPLATDDASRWIALIWRATSPRGEDFRTLARLIQMRAELLLADV